MKEKKSNYIKTNNQIKSKNKKNKTKKSKGQKGGSKNKNEKQSRGDC